MPFICYDFYKSVVFHNSKHKPDLRLPLLLMEERGCVVPRIFLFFDGGQSLRIRQVSGGLKRAVAFRVSKMRLASARMRG